MEAKDMRKKAFDSIAKEVDQVEAKIAEAAANGSLKVTIPDLSDSVRVYLEEKGFKVKLYLDPKEFDKDPDKGKKFWSVNW
jgi:hypothetical protein